MKYKIRPITLFLITISYLGIALPALGHELWLEAQNFQPKTGETLNVEIRNGQEFKGIELGYFDDRAVIFDWFQNGEHSPVNSRAGDFPALSMTVENDGLLVLAYQTKFSTVQYQTLDKFLAFAKHKDFPDAEALHAERNLPQGQFSEIYTRFCKSLIGVGIAGGQDVETSMETEFVAQSNPYTDDLSGGFSVKLFYLGQPRANAQIEVFRRAPDGKIEITYQRTDNQGQAIIPVLQGHTYLLDAVVLRVPLEGTITEHKAVWQTLWASMTFSVPG